MKQFKPVIITAVICLVLAGIMFAAFKLIPEETPEAPVTNNSSTTGAIHIIQKSANSVKQAEIETDWGEKFTIVYEIDENGDQVASLKKADKRFEYNTSEMYTLAGYLGIMAGIEEIPDTKGRDEEFGFKKPKRRIKVDYTDGTKIELLLGADSPLGEGVYLKRVDTEKVYLIGGSTTDMLMMSLKDYRVAKLFDQISDISLIKSVSITHPGQDKFTVQVKEDAEPVSETNPYAAQYEITKPVKADANNDPVETKLLEPLIAIKVASLVEDDPKDLEKYGLDKPIKVEFETTEKQKVSFKIGARAEDGGRYVMRDDVPAVMVTEADIAWDSLDYTDLMMQLLWLHNMDQVSSIEYRLPDGSRHTLNLDVNSNEIKASFDGSELAKENASNLFLLSIRFTLQGAIDKSMKYGAPEVEMHMTLKDGSKTSLKLSRINERQYAASVDDEPAKFYVNVNEVNELVDAFGILASGGTIPDMF